MKVKIKKKITLINILTILLVTIIISFMSCIVYIICSTNMYPVKYKSEVTYYSKLYNFEPSLIYSIIKTESGFDKDSVSEKGAIGLMQVTPSTANYVSKFLNKQNYDLYDADTNISFGCFYLNYLYKKFGNIETAILAYNAGEGNVNLWLNNPSFSTDGTKVDNIPFLETENYIKKIDKSFQKYKNLYGKNLDK